VIRTLFLLATMLVMAGCAAVQPVPESNRTFDAVFDTPGASKDQIFSATKIWIAETFRSAKAVIEYENKEEGTLIGNGIVPYPCGGIECVAKGDWSVPFTMRVDMKDQKFKLTFSNIRVSWPPSYNSTYGAQPGHDGPVNLKGDFDSIKPRLLGLGPELVAAVQHNAVKKDW
jgi:hypothetical protein